MRSLLTTREVAEALALSRSKVAALIATGEIESVRVGRARRVPVEAVRTFVDQLKVLESSPPAA